MLAQLDDVIFETNSNIKELTEKLTFNYTRIDRVGNNPTYHSMGGCDQEISFSGYFVLKSLDELDELKEVAQKEEPVWFVQKDTHLQVLISELIIKKSKFLKSGEFIKQAFDISLKRYFI